MIRNIIGSILALAGAAAAVLSPFLSWYNGREGQDYQVSDLFDGISGTDSGVWESLLAPMLFAALVTLIGLVLRSRLLVALAGAVVLGFTVLWMVRQGQAAGSLTVTGNENSGVGPGVGYALGGGLTLLIAALVMSGRRRQPSWVEPAAVSPPEQFPGAGYGQQSGYGQSGSAYGQEPPVSGFQDWPDEQRAPAGYQQDQPALQPSSTGYGQHRRPQQTSETGYRQDWPPREEPSQGSHLFRDEEQPPGPWPHPENDTQSVETTQHWQDEPSPRDQDQRDDGGDQPAPPRDTSQG